MMAIFGSLALAPWILFAQMSWGMDAVPVITAAPPPSEVTAEVRDLARVFGRDAEWRAREALERIHDNLRIPVHIETVESLDGAWIADIAWRRARAADPEQLYILVAASERDVGVISSRRGPARQLTEQDRESIRRAFLAPLQVGDADAALERGVHALGTRLAAAAASGPEVNAWGVLSSVALLLGILALLHAAQARASYGGRNRRRRRNAAGATPLGDARDASRAGSTASRFPPPDPANHTGQPRRTARSPALRRETVEA